MIWLSLAREESVLRLHDFHVVRNSRREAIARRLRYFSASLMPSLATSTCLRAGIPLRRRCSHFHRDLISNIDAPPF